MYYMREQPITLQVLKQYKNNDTEIRLERRKTGKRLSVDLFVNDKIHGSYLTIRAATEAWFSTCEEVNQLRKAEQKSLF